VRSLGLDLGGTNIKLVVVEDGRVVDRAEAPTLSEEGAAAVLERMAELVRGAGHVGSVGVALPGLFDADGVAVLLPNLHGDWTGRAIREPLERSLDSRVSLINDGHAFALAEATFGAGRGGGNVMCVVCGTGIGGGLVLDGRLHLGPEQRAGSSGTTPWSRTARCASAGTTAVSSSTPEPAGSLRQRARSRSTT